MIICKRNQCLYTNRTSSGTKASTVNFTVIGLCKSFAHKFMYYDASLFVIMHVFCH